MKEERETYDAMMRGDLPFFAEEAFKWLNPGTSLYRNWSHEAVCYRLERTINREVKRLIVNQPPRSLKSFLVSVAFPAFVLGNNPTEKFICVSYSQDLANKHASDFRKIVEHEEYRRIFNVKEPSKNTEAEYQTSEGGFRRTTSVNGTLTGLGGNIIIVDDPQNAEEVRSKSNRAKVNEWFRSTLSSRLDDKATGVIIVVMQRLHPEDLTGFLLAEPEWQHLNLPAIATATIEVPLYANRKHFWIEGTPLQAGREPLALLDRLRNQLGPEVFAAQYMQEPVPPSGNMLKEEWLKTVDIMPTRQDGDEIVLSWDTASKATERSDYSVGLVFLVRNKNQYYLLEVLRKRLEFPELVRAVVDQAARHNPTAILIENHVSGIALIQQLKRDRVQGVIGFMPKLDKVTRMYVQTPKLQASSLILPRSAPGLGTFRMEYLSYPLVRHDDQIDALSQFLTWCSERDSNILELSLLDVRGPPDGAPSPDEILGWRG